MWTYSLYKTLTYEALANGADLILYATVLGGTVAASAPFLAVNALSAASVYYVHELTWNLLGPAPQTTAGAVELGLTKTLTYRVVGTAQHLAVAYAFTGDLWASLGYAAAVNVTAWRSGGTVTGGRQAVGRALGLAAHGAPGTIRRGGGCRPVALSGLLKRVQPHSCTRLGSA